MAKFKLIKDYSQQYKKAGVPPPNNVVTTTFKAGIIIDGIYQAGFNPPGESLMASRGAGVTTTIDGRMPMAGSVGETTVFIPMTALESLEPMSINPSGKIGNWWKNMSGLSKGVLITVVLIGGYYGLKHFKVIK